MVDAMSIMNYQFMKNINNEISIKVRANSNILAQQKGNTESLQLFLVLGLVALLMMLCVMFAIICCFLERKKTIRNLNAMLVLRKMQWKKKPAMIQPKESVAKKFERIRKMSSHWRK